MVLLELQVLSERIHLVGTAQLSTYVILIVDGLVLEMGCR